MGLTPMEQLAWREHFEKYPPGDFYLQKLVADLVVMLSRFMGGDDVTHQGIAPWLYPKTPDTEQDDPSTTVPGPNEDYLLKTLQAIQDNKDA